MKQETLLKGLGTSINSILKIIEKNGLIKVEKDTINYLILALML